MDSLKSLVIYKIVSELLFHITQNRGSLMMLPSHLQDRILQIILSPGLRYPKNKIKMEDILSTLKNCSTEIIILSSIDYNNDQILESLKQFENVRKIVFPSPSIEKNGTTNITKIGLIKLFESFQNLESLTITNEKNLTDETVKCLAENCTKLKILDLTGCSKLTNNGFGYLKDMELSCLNLSKTAISDHGLLLIIQGRCGLSLKELKVDHCPRITSDSINEVASHCALDYLSFNYIGDTISMEDIEFMHTPKDISWCIF